MKTLVTIIALAMLSLSAFSQQKEMVQTQRAETQQTFSQQSSQQYIGPQRQVVPSQTSQPAVQYTAPVNNQQQTYKAQPASHQNRGEMHTYAERKKHPKDTCKSNSNKADLHADDPLSERLPKVCNNENDSYRIVYICPFCGRVYYSDGYCTFDHTKLEAKYVDVGGSSR